MSTRERRRTMQPDQPEAETWRTPRSLDSLFENLPEHSGGVSHPVTRAMLLRWQGKSYARMDVPDERYGDEGLSRLVFAIREERPDLQAAFDVSTATGRSKLLCWLLQSGRKELEITWDSPEWQRYTLAEIDPRLPEDPTLPISRLMAHIWFGRPDIQKAFPLDSRASRGRFVAWFYFVWFNEKDYGSYLLPQQLAWLFKNIPGTRLRRDAWLLWMYMPRLTAAFPLSNPESVPKYVQWFAQRGTAILRSIQDRKKELTANTAQRVFAAPSARGVNLIGYAFGELGIGEDLRTAVACLEKAGIPYSIFNVAPGANVSQKDTTLQGRVSDDLPYDINLFCITGMETVRVFVLHGRSLFDGRYNIGWWPWELPVWPKRWVDAYALVDEIWAATKYTGNAYRKSAPVPVRRVPLAVTLDVADAAAASGLGRSHFGLPEKSYLFYFSFDFNSTLERKNPWACLKAFRAAFRGKRSDVGLVIKVMHTSPDDPNWRKLQAEIARDRRIILIDRSLRRNELLAFYAACDCYVSLHRAEGFGRGVAEAMLLGKDVIVSDYSGTRDFAYGPRVHPVKGRLVTIKAGDYPGASGKERWFDADVDETARIMREVAARPIMIARRKRKSGCERLSISYVAGEVESALRDARHRRESSGEVLVGEAGSISATSARSSPSKG